MLKREKLKTIFEQIAFLLLSMHGFWDIKYFSKINNNKILKYNYDENLFDTRTIILLFYRHILLQIFITELLLFPCISFFLLFTLFLVFVVSFYDNSMSKNKNTNATGKIHSVQSCCCVEWKQNDSNLFILHNRTWIQIVL